MCTYYVMCGCVGVFALQLCMALLCEKHTHTRAHTHTHTHTHTRRLTDYVYELSERFNAFYVECKVLGSEEESSRLQLVEATARVMRQCFSLLGLTPLYRI